MTAMQELIVRCTGKIQESNFDEWKAGMLVQIKAANKELKTDNDFSAAEATVKELQAAEQQLADFEEVALKDASDILALLDARDEFKEETRQARLGLERQIKTRKEEIKQELIKSFTGEAVKLYADCCKNTPDFKIVSPTLYTVGDFREAIKGKKTVKSMDSALNDLLDDIGKRIRIESARIQSNRELMNSIGSKLKSLFQDEGALLGMSDIDLAATIQKRIATHEAEELKRNQIQHENNNAEKAEPKATHSKHEAPADAVVQQKVALLGTSQKEDFTLTIDLLCMPNKAKEIARQIFDEHADRDEVGTIFLSRTNSKAA